MFGLVRYIMDRHTLLIKTVKKSSSTKTIFKINSLICSILLITDLVLYLVHKSNLNLVLYISFLVGAIILAIVNLIFYFQIKFYREVIDYLISN